MQVTRHIGYLIEDTSALGALRSILRSSAERFEALAAVSGETYAGTYAMLARELREGVQTLNVRCETVYREVPKVRQAEVVAAQ